MHTIKNNRWNRRLLALGFTLVVVLGLVVFYQAKSVRAGSLDLLGGNGDFETTTKYNNWGTNAGNWSLSQFSGTTYKNGSYSARMYRQTTSNVTESCYYYYNFTTPVMPYGIATLNPVLTGTWWKGMSSTNATTFNLRYELVKVSDQTVAYGTGLSSGGTVGNTSSGFSYNLDNLEAGTTYQLKLIADITSGGSSTRTFNVYWDDLNIIYTDNPPTINNITAPANGTNQKGTLALQANVVDDVGINNVDFQYDTDSSFTAPTTLSGATLVSGTDTNGTWSLNWDTSGLNGTYYVRAVASDKAAAAIGGPYTLNSSTFTYYLDNTLPSAATLIEPPDSGVRMGTITLTANAKDNTGVTALDFVYANNPTFTGATTVTGATITAGTATDGTWTKSFNTAALSDGTWYFRAIATDGWANSFTGASNLMVVDNTTPSAATVTSPADGSQISGTINMTANAQDNLHTDKVYFECSDDTAFSNPTVHSGATMTAGTVTNGTWQYSGFDTTLLPDGPRYVRAKVYDEAGNTYTGNYVTANFHNLPPTVAQMWSPANNSTIGGVKNFLATAEDAIGIASVHFQYSTESNVTNGTLLAASPIIDMSGWWELFVDTSSIPDGSYYFRVKATDTAGNVLFGPEVVSRIDNQPPTFSIEYFKDVALTQHLETTNGKAMTTAQTVYIKVIPSEPLNSDAPTLYISAPGTTNARTGVSAPLTSGNYVYKWDVAADVDGDATIKVSGTSKNNNMAIQVVPTSGGTVGIDTSAAAPALTGAKGVGRTFLNWSTLPDARRYYVYRSTQDGFTPDDGTNKIAEVVAPASGYTDIVGDGTYYYRIKVIDVAGNISDYSGQIMETSAPATVTMVAYWDDSSGGGTTVSWATDVTPSGADLVWQAGTVYAPGTTNAYTFVPNTKMYENYYFKVVKPGETRIIKGFPTTNSDGEGNWIDTGYGHGNFDRDTEFCADCHVTHSGLKQNLLREATYYDLCMFCHGTASTQSKYDVQSGKVLTMDGWKNSLAGPIGSAYGVSKHNVDDRGDVVSTVYGSAPGKTLTFTCLSCHKPHAGKNDNYRLLREVIYPADDRLTPTTVNFTAYAVVKDAAVGEEAYLVSGSSEFCAACHQDYVKGSAQEAGGTYNNFFRHPVTVDGKVYSVYNVSKSQNLFPQGGEKLPLQSYPEGDSPGLDKRTAVVCLTCHYAHGSYRNFNEGYPMANGQPRLYLQNQKMLREDNYGVCESCHQK